MVFWFNIWKKKENLTLSKLDFLAIMKEDSPSEIPTNHWQNCSERLVFVKSFTCISSFLMEKHRTAPLFGMQKKKWILKIVYIIIFVDFRCYKKKNEVSNSSTDQPSVCLIPNVGHDNKSSSLLRLLVSPLNPASIL